MHLDGTPLQRGQQVFLREVTENTHNGYTRRTVNLRPCTVRDTNEHVGAVKVELSAGGALRQQWVALSELSRTALPPAK